MNKEITWETLFESLLIYRFDNPQKGYFKVPEDHPLYEWTEEQKKLFMENQMNSYHMMLFNLIKFEFVDNQTQDDETWLLHYQELLEFYNTYHTLKIPNEYYTKSEIDLHSWLHMQKQRQRKGQLKSYQIYKLELLGIQWIKKKEKKISEWDKYYAVAEKFYSKYGHLLISRNYVTPNGIELGKWVNEQRDNHWGIGRRKLKQQEYDKLNKIGMYWENLEQGKWEFFLKTVQEYAKEHSFPIDENLIYKNYPLAKQLKFYLGKQEKVRELQRILPNNSKWFK